MKEGIIKCRGTGCGVKNDCWRFVRDPMPVQPYIDPPDKSLYIHDICPMRMQISTPYWDRTTVDEVRVLFPSPITVSVSEGHYDVIRIGDSLFISESVYMQVVDKYFDGAAYFIVLKAYRSDMASAPAIVCAEWW